LNSVKRKRLMRPSAALLAEYKRREAVGAPPLERSRLAALACGRLWNPLGIEEAA